MLEAESSGFCAGQAVEGTEVPIIFAPALPLGVPSSLAIQLFSTRIDTFPAFAPAYFC
jgi:hypothetical protein